jgi:UDP-GlcNAc:undecaprenyl-phosphate GlcNAc-1-phosphate transferase
MLWLIIGAMVPSLLITWSLGFVIRGFARRMGLVDQPGPRKVHATPVPLGGGIAIWAGVTLPLLVGLIVLWTGIAPLPSFAQIHAEGLQQQTGDLLFLLACGTVLMLLGLCDDRRGLDWRVRLIAQTCIAVLVVVWRGWRLTMFVDLPQVTALVSVIWIVGLVNSFNMLDNMDGLSAGVAAIAASMLAAVMLMAPDPQTSQPQLFVAGMLLVLVGSLLGFLWHNRPQARLFMGDAGSYFIGFVLAVITILATFSGGKLPQHAILAPLCVFAVPLYDTISVLCIRLRAGRSLFEGDKNHLSHRLVELGLSKPQAVLTIYLMTAACGLGALVLHQVNTAGAVTVFLSIVCLLAVIAILETTARKKVAGRKSEVGKKR